MVSAILMRNTMADSVRNVIESGEVFTTSHLEILEGTLDEIDSSKDEVH
jgi:hypothetical protein